MIDPFGTPRFFFMSGRVCHIPVALDPPEINDDGGDDGDDKDDDNDEDEDDDEDDDLCRAVHVLLINYFVRLEVGVTAPPDDRFISVPAGGLHRIVRGFLEFVVNEHNLLCFNLI